MNKKNKKGLTLFCIAVFILSLSIFSNFTKKIDDSFFNNFQQDSEKLIIGKIQADANNLDTGNYGYGNYNYDTNTFKEYTSLVGAQGYFYSFISNNLGMSSINVLHLITSFLTSIILVSLSWLISKRYSKLFGITFFFSCLLSPWVISMGRNLYWVEYLMFLPAVFVLLLLQNKNKKYNKYFYFLILLSSFVKSLCGYEYISTIFIFAATFPFVEFILEKNKEKKIELFKIVIKVSIALVLGFVAAISIHGLIRGEGNLLIGINDIWNQDVLRRTLGGDVSNFDPAFTASLLATPIDVLKIYIFNFQTDIVAGVSGASFPIVICISSMILIFESINSKKIVNFKNLMFILFFITSVSWLILGKSHSYIHTHINYIVWYFGFIQFCFYIIASWLYSLFIEHGIHTNIDKSKFEGEIKYD